MTKLLGLIVAVALSSCSIASNHSISLPENTSDRLIASELAMTTEDLLNAYMSNDVHQRRLAEMYVIGVLDGSEGEDWCGFDIASPNALQEQVYAGLKKTLETSPKQRASTAITSRLKDLLPCEE